MMINCKRMNDGTIASLRYEARESDTTNKLSRHTINGVDLKDWSHSLAKEALARVARHADERIREG